jgi:hypothetical protein
MNRQQRRIEAAKARAERRSASGLPNWRGGSGFKVGNAFMLSTEVEKAVKMMCDDLPLYDVKATKADYDAKFSTPQAGFLFALCPRTERGIAGKESGAHKAFAVAEGYQKTHFGDHWMLLSTYITSDLAYDHFLDLHDCFGSAFVFYSTPENICSLSEDRDFCLALKHQRNPMDLLEITSEVNG